MNSRQIKKLHADAFNQRRRIIGTLESCICAYPLVQEATESGHVKTCPSHEIHLFYQRREVADATSASAKGST